MRTIQKIKIAVSVILVALLSVSCLPEQESMGDAGQTLVKMTPDGFKLIALDASETSQKADMFIIRKDANNETMLNTATTVVLQKDDALLTAYNTANGTSFVALPTTLATTNPAPAADGKITLDFASGDAAKVIAITIPNASKFDFSKQYALAYKLVSVAGAGKKSEAVSDEIVVQVLVKNKYDGVYEVTAITPMVDVANSALTGYYPFTYNLETSGAHSCKCWDATVWGDYMHPIMSGTSASGYGSFGLEVFFDPSGNGNIIDVKNTAGNPPSNTRMPAIDPSGINKWDAATRNIYFKYWMKQPNTVTTPPYIRTYFDEKWTYKGAR